MIRIFTCLSVALLLAACGGAGDAVGVDVYLGDAPPETSIGEDTRSLPEVVEVVGVDVVAEVGVDALPDLGSACEPGDGCFLDPCDENADCQSGWCVEHLGESVCSQLCLEDCPDGWTCKQVGDTEPDVIFICVSNVADLCKPCATSEGCDSGVEGVCLDYGDEGSFCGAACEVDGDCPFGFLCQEATSVSGVASMQCVAEAGVCPCSGKSIELALSTPCEFSNDFGTCEGQRVCLEEGLSDCDAAVPAEEVCNGVDDNCDGDIDEAFFIEGQYVDLCDDGNPCTQDLCKGEGGCESVALTGDECVDGDPCTVTDQCMDGVCTGTPIVCDDENPCTDDACLDGACQHTPNTLPCDDGDPCTVGDHCGDGACAGEAVDCACQSNEDCADLEDGDLCTGTLFCDLETFPYQCAVVPDSPIDCPEPEGPDAPCLAAVCDGETGECSFEEANDGAPCDDGDACTLSDACLAGLCEGGPAPNCNDGNSCTDDVCHPEAGCVHTDNTEPCDDGDTCTTDDTCADGACIGGEALACDDGNACTDDGCDPDIGCTHAANTEPCDDGNACTENDACSGGDCAGGQALPCNDDNVCTDDSCDMDTGCVYVNNEAPCSDDDACTVNETCSGGACAGGQPLNCNDGDVCTDDACEADTGCVYTFNEEPCDDGSECTLIDVCAGGVCVGSQAPDCDDQNLCTDDSCDPDLGCQNVPNNALCAEATCTEGDFHEASYCAEGACPDQVQVVCSFLCDDVTGCFGECTPGALQCDGLVVQLCLEDGSWDDQETCPVGCSAGVCTVPEGPILAGENNTNPNLFMNNDGHPVVLFQEADQDHSDVRIAVYSGDWEVETIFAGYRLGRQAADQDDQGRYHLVMGKFGESSVSYGVGPDWVIDSVVTGIPTGGPTGALDDDGHFHITTSTSLSTRKYATNASGAWVSSPVANSSTGTAAIAIDGLNPATIVYNQWNTRRIYVTEGPDFAGGQHLLQSYGVDQGPPLSLKYFGGERHLVYAYTHDYYTHYHLKYSTDVSGGWQTTTLVTSGPGVSGLDISMDPDGHAHVVHCNKDKHMLYHSNLSGSWQSAQVLNGTCGSGTLDTLYHDGEVLVVYRTTDNVLTLLKIDPSVLQ